MSNTINLLLDGVGVFINACDKNDVDMKKWLNVLKEVTSHDVNARHERQEIAAQRQDAVPKIAEFYRAHPDSRLEPREVLAEVGLPDTKGNRGFLRYQIKQLQLTHVAA